MALPPSLLRAIASPGGGGVSLIIGAGCSLEAPTKIPVASQMSVEIHQMLIDDGVLEEGDCDDPSDLSVVADTVFANTGSQREIVVRLRERYDFQLATPNKGYLLLAAMLFEGAVSSVVTLNFDVALTHALSEVGAGGVVGVINCPDELDTQKNINIYYLHRNVHENNLEQWVLRSDVIRDEWVRQWEPVVTTKALVAPVVVFAGLGTPVSVLITSTNLIKEAIPKGNDLFQVDPRRVENSKFFQELGIEEDNYIQRGWCEFMEELALRLMKEQEIEITKAIARKVEDDRLHVENIESLLEEISGLGLIGAGKLRAAWLLADKPYKPVDQITCSLLADLLLALALIERVAGCAVRVLGDGFVELVNEHGSTKFYVASGCGHRGRTAIEGSIESMEAIRKLGYDKLQGVIVGGTSGNWNEEVSAPRDLVDGAGETDNIVGNTAKISFYHIEGLRNNTIPVGTLCR